MKRKPRSKQRYQKQPNDRYRELWLSLTPRERLRLSWRLRRYLRKLEEARDGKSLTKP